ncbi:MAG: hypothetical protein WAT92_25700 [Saprospiraceae bacterium]|nr:hypothetical protein [Saprospiraceae bacterium]
MKKVCSTKDVHTLAFRKMHVNIKTFYQDGYDYQKTVQSYILYRKADIKHE